MIPPQRCGEAENKVFLIMDWVNAALLDDPSSSKASDIPSVMIDDDFGPSTVPSAKATITKMSRAQLSQMDLASFTDRFGTLPLGSGRRGGLGVEYGFGHKMLSEESGSDLVGMMGADEVF